MKEHRSSAYNHQQSQFEALQVVESILAEHGLLGSRGPCTRVEINSHHREGQVMASKLSNHPRMRIHKINYCAA